MKTTQEIQDLINAKADKRLTDDLEALHRTLNSGTAYFLLKSTIVNIGSSDTPKMESLSHILGPQGLRTSIIEKNQQRYRERETKEFLEKVESLRDDVDHLLNTVNQ